MRRFQIVKGRTSATDAPRPAVSMLSIYATELLRLVFAEDRTALYVEGFTVLGACPDIVAQLSYLQDETNLHILRVLQLFRAADTAGHARSDALEAKVADHIASYVDAPNLSNSGDVGLLKASMRMEEYLLEQYGVVIAQAGCLRLAADRACLESIYAAKLARRDALRQVLDLHTGTPGRREAEGLFSASHSIDAN